MCVFFELRFSDCLCVVGGTSVIDGSQIAAPELIADYHLRRERRFETRADKATAKVEVLKSKLTETKRKSASIVSELKLQLVDSVLETRVWKAKSTQLEQQLEETKQPQQQGKGRLCVCGGKLRNKGNGGVRYAAGQAVYQRQMLCDDCGVFSVEDC